ncbi:hypothetical protein QA596_09325 [Balneolales bacterium ANBcel1]|nr:hypothetical protein [Balneolales bacterium ANBcel1]
MKRMMLSATMIIVVLFLTGCYHAQVTTGLPESGEVHTENWHSTLINGLITLDDAIEAQRYCSDGVAKVETKLSFLNQVVAILSFSIYTPMTIEITCAASSDRYAFGSDGEPMEAHVIPGCAESQQECLAAFEKAAALAAELQSPIFLNFR